MVTSGDDDPAQKSQSANGGKGKDGGSGGGNEKKDGDGGKSGSDVDALVTAIEQETGSGSVQVEDSGTEEVQMVVSLDEASRQAIAETIDSVRRAVSDADPQSAFKISFEIPSGFTAGGISFDGSTFEISSRQPTAAGGISPGG